LELPELLRCCDRILVLNGRVTAHYDTGDATQEDHECGHRAEVGPDASRSALAPAASPCPNLAALLGISSSLS
jgi:hypothetical protein